MAGRRAADFWVRLLFFAGWACGLVGIVGLGRQPFSGFAALGGALIIGSGIALAAGGERAMARLNQRYTPWRSPASYRFMAAAMVFIGACWIVAAVAA
jgi:hypothetical protein